MMKNHSRLALQDMHNLILAGPDYGGRDDGH